MRLNHSKNPSEVVSCCSQVYHSVPNFPSMRWSKVDLIGKNCTLWQTNKRKSQLIWYIGGGDTDVTHYMGGIASFYGNEWLGGMIQTTGQKILLFLGNLIPCMDLVISSFIQLEVQLSIFMRQRYLAYIDAITLFFCKNGKLHGCGEVLGRTCCTKYTSTQSCPFLNTVHNEYHPRYFSRMVELGYPLSNLRVHGAGLLLLLQEMVFLLLLLQGVGLLLL